MAKKRTKQWIDSDVITKVDISALGGIMIPAGTRLKLSGSVGLITLNNTPCDCCRVSYSIHCAWDEVELHDHLEFVKETKQAIPTLKANNNPTITIQEMAIGNYYRVDYQEGAFVIGKFKRTNGVNLFWQIPLYLNWGGRESISSIDWSVNSFIASVKLATDEEITQLKDMATKHERQAS